MSEERTQYTAGGKVTPDNAGAAMQLITEKYIAQLERTIDGYAMIQGRHAEMIAERDRRIAELEAQIAAVPVDVIRRYHTFTHYDVHAANDAEYTVQQFDEDDNAIRAWLDGDA